MHRRLSVGQAYEPVTVQSLADDRDQTQVHDALIFQGLELLEPRLLLSGLPTVDHCATLFLSDKGLGQGALLGVPNLELRPGEQVTLYLWARVPQDMIINGLTLDVLASSHGVVQTDGSSIANPVVNGSARWESNVNRGYPSDLWKNLRLFAVQTAGINGELQQLDPTYDTQADAYLVGSLTFTAMAAGRTELFLESNTGGGLAYRMTDEPWAETADPWVQLGDDAPVIAYGSGVRSEHAEAMITVLSGPPVAPLPQVKDYRPIIDVVLPDDGVISEGGAPIDLVITRDRETETSLTINLLVSGSASPNEMRIIRGNGGFAKIQVVDGQYYLRVTFEAGSDSVQFSLSTPRDSQIEHTEQFNLNLLSGENYQVGEGLRALSLDVLDFDQYATLFLSDRGLGEGAELTAQHLTLTQGQQSTLYLWAKVPQGVTLQSLWIVVSERYTIDLLSADGASAENPTVAGQSRWKWRNALLAGAWGQNWAFQFSGTDDTAGVDGDAQSQDPTYDPQADAYLLGAITFTAMTPGDTQMMISVNFPSLVDRVYEGQSGPAPVAIGEDPTLVSLNKGDGHLSAVPLSWITVLPAPVVDPPLVETPLPTQPEPSPLEPVVQPQEPETEPVVIIPPTIEDFIPDIPPSVPVTDVPADPVTPPADEEPQAPVPSEPISPEPVIPEDAIVVLPPVYDRPYTLPWDGLISWENERFIAIVTHDGRIVQWGPQPLSSFALTASMSGNAIAVEAPSVSSVAASDIAPTDISALALELRSLLATGPLADPAELSLPTIGVRRSETADVTTPFSAGLDAADAAAAMRRSQAMTALWALDVPASETTAKDVASLWPDDPQDELI